MREKRDRKRFTVNVIVGYEFEAEDGDKVERVVDAFRMMNMGRKEVEKSVLRKDGVSQTVVPYVETAFESFPLVTAMKESQSSVIANTYPKIVNNENSLRDEVILDCISTRKESDELKTIGNCNSPNVNLSNSKHVARLEDLDVIKLIGEGSFGQVLLVRKKGTRHLFAMKIIKVDSNNSNEIKYSV